MLYIYSWDCVPAILYPIWSLIARTRSSKEASHQENALSGTVRFAKGTLSSHQGGAPLLYGSTRWLYNYSLPQYSIERSYHPDLLKTYWRTLWRVRRWTPVIWLGTKELWIRCGLVHPISPPYIFTGVSEHNGLQWSCCFGVVTVLVCGWQNRCCARTRFVICRMAGGRLRPVIPYTGMNLYHPTLDFVYQVDTTGPRRWRRCHEVVGFCHVSSGMEWHGCQTQFKN